METRKLLLPIDVSRCRPAVFDVVNRFARRKFNVTAILLHVVTLNVMAAENRIYEELTTEAELYLDKLSAQYIDPDVFKVRRVRMGKAAEEILAEAAAEHPDMIVMTVDRTSLHNGNLLHRLRLSTSTLSRTVNAVLKKASCEVLVLPTEGDLDCERVWGRVSDVVAPAPFGLLTGRVNHVPAR